MYQEIVPQRLKKARIDNGFTQEEISKETGIARTKIVKIEKGQQNPDVETLGILADFYGVSVDWLLGTKGDKGINHAKIERDYYRENK